MGNGADNEIEKKEVDEDGFTTYQKRCIAHQEKKDKTEKLRTYLSGISPCSGESNNELREFIAALDFAHEYSQADEEDFIANTISLSREPLRTVIDLHLKKCKEENRPQIWSELKDTITASCLSADEKEYLRDKLEQMSQGQSEDIRTFSLRFIESMQRAYSSSEYETEIVKERLIKLLIRGFANAAVRERVILEKPKSVKETAEKAVEYARALHLAHASAKPNRYHREEEKSHTFLRQEEPMDLDSTVSIRPRPKSPHEYYRRGRRSRSKSTELEHQMRNLNINKEVHFKPQRERQSRRDKYEQKAVLSTEDNHSYPDTTILETKQDNS